MKKKSDFSKGIKKYLKNQSGEMGHDERERKEGVLKENNESSAGQIVKNSDIL